MNNPLITIVTVVRDSKEELEQTITGVLSQTYENIEYIIIDGGSTDGTLDIIKKYDDDIDYWVSEPDNGPFEAMNKAVDLASGEWINFMNAGDYFYKTDVIQKVFSDYPPDADIIYGHHYWKLTDNRLILRNAAEFHDIWKKLETADLSIPWLQSIPCHQSLFCKTRLLKKTKFDLTFKIAADHHFMFEAYSNHCKFFNSNEIITVYSDGGISTDSHIKCIKEQWRIAKKYQKRFKVNTFFLFVIVRILESKYKTFEIISNVLQLKKILNPQTHGKNK